MRKCFGFSRLELLAATILIGVFAAALLNRLSFYQEAAEKAKVEYTISLLKSALRIKMATMLAEGRTSSLTTLEHQNPMDWLEEKPAKYQSVAASADSSKNFSGTWKFDPAERTLTYWPIRKDHLKADKTGQQRIRLRVEVVRLNAGQFGPAGGEPSSGAAPILGVRLVIEPYQWFGK